MTVGQLIGVLRACNAGDKVQVRIGDRPSIYTGRIVVTYDKYDVLTLVVRTP